MKKRPGIMGTNPETTPGIERGARRLAAWKRGTADVLPGDVRTVRDVVAAALDVEEIARIISSHRHGSQVAWDEDRRIAAALRAAILGEGS